MYLYSLNIYRISVFTRRSWNVHCRGNHLFSDFVDMLRQFSCLAVCGELTNSLFYFVEVKYCKETYAESSFQKLRQGFVSCDGSFVVDHFPCMILKD